MTRNPSPADAALVAALDARLAGLEMAVYRSLVGIIQGCDEVAAQADANGLVRQAIRARLLASDVRSRQGLSAQGRDEQLALQAQARPWPALARRAATYLASSCDRLGLRLEAMHWVEASVAADPVGDPAPGRVRGGHDSGHDGEPNGEHNGTPTDPQADSAAWQAEALMVAALLAGSRKDADYTLVERAWNAVRAACGPLLASVTAANFAEVASESGELVHASHFADEAEAIMRRNPECASALTWESVARARLATDELAGAEHAMRESLRLEEQLGCCDVNGDPWLSYAEVLLARGDAAQAMGQLEHPRRLQRQATSSWTGTRELRVRARVLAALGNWEAAYRRMEDYVAAYQQARSLEGDRAAAESSAAVAVDDARRQAQHFEQLALTDALTGLPNRRHAERWLAEHAATGAGWLCVAIADLDHFKRINDSYSHDAGDVVLQRLGGLFSAGMQGPGMFVARLGGEEFLLAFAGVAPDAALVRCQALVDQLRQTPFTDVLGAHTVTVSIGLAHALRPVGGNQLQREADGALYQAKHAGRDRVVALPVPSLPTCPPSVPA